VSRPLLILVVTLVVVAASYYGFSRFDASAGTAASANVAEKTPAATTAVAASATQSTPSAPPGTFAIAISKAHPPAPSDVIRVNKDDQVTLAITSDRAGHLEVHGYKKEVTVEPGTTATLSFTAVRTGRFPIDLHGSDGAHVEVSALEVMPR
jgi:heme/copper-type cytochrome/quinol oxidase subunit 2